MAAPIPSLDLKDLGNAEATGGKVGDSSAVFSSPFIVGAPQGSIASSLQVLTPVLIAGAAVVALLIVLRSK